MTRVDLRIDELVLDGVAARDRHRVADAIERELARLIADRGLPPALRSADEPRAPAIVVTAGARPDDLGKSVAAAIYGALAPAARPPRDGGS